MCGIFLSFSLCGGIGGFVISGGLLLPGIVFFWRYWLGFGWCVYYFVISVFVVFIGWYICVCFLARVGRPRPFIIGSSFLRLVVYFVFRIRVAFVLLVLACEVVIVCVGVIRGSIL